MVSWVVPAETDHFCSSVEREYIRVGRRTDGGLRSTLTRFKTVCIKVDSKMTSKEEDKELGTKIVFSGKDEDWQDFYDKFKAYGEYKKWWTALEKDASEDKDEIQKTARKKAKYALVMCTTGDAAAYVRADSDPFYGWKALLERYDNKDGNDLKALYKKWETVLNEGPGLKDPKLWFLLLDEKEKDIVAAGGKKKDSTEIVALLETTMAGKKGV